MTRCACEIWRNLLVWCSGFSHPCVNLDGFWALTFICIAFVTTGSGSLFPQPASLVPIARSVMVRLQMCANIWPSSPAPGGAAVGLETLHTGFPEVSPHLRAFQWPPQRLARWGQGRGMQRGCLEGCFCLEMLFWECANITFIPVGNFSKTRAF